MDRTTADDAVTLPAGVRLTGADRELVQAVAAAIAGLHREGDHPWRETVERLERDGWAVTWRVGFIAEARRRDDHETAAAPTRDEAFEKLWHLTLMDGVVGCP